MKLAIVAFLLAATALSGTDRLTGTWHLRSTYPDGPGLKTVAAVILELEVDGGTLTGLVHIGSWPGDAPIAEGKVRGDRIVFEATGHLDSSTGIPTCRFEGTLNGEELIVKMTMTQNAAAHDTFVFKGKKQP